MSYDNDNDEVGILRRVMVVDKFPARASFGRSIPLSFGSFLVHEQPLALAQAASTLTSGLRKILSQNEVMYFISL